MRTEARRMTPRRLPRPPGRPPAILALTVVALLALLLASATAGAQAGLARIDRLTATPTQAASDGGRITITVSVSDHRRRRRRRSPWRPRAGRSARRRRPDPHRASPVAPGPNGAAVRPRPCWSANGSAGRATITAFVAGGLAARHGALHRRARPACAFLAPAGRRRCRSEESHPLTVQVYDLSRRVPVPGARP